MKIFNEDCLLTMETMEENSVDSIVTDPPYGISFMGKDWDHGIPGVHFWESALRVAKPGAYLLAFGGTRTFHRLAVAIEDAGWEIRDTVMWVYGSGFPKSLDVSKAIDKMKGAGRRVVGSKGTRPIQTSGRINSEDGAKGRFDREDNPITIPSTDEAKQWEGWGTALKPAVELIVLAQKPLDITALCNILAKKIGDALCQLQSNVSAVEKSSKSNQNESGVEYDSVRWSAGKKCSTLEDLYDLMDTLPSGSEIPLSLSIGLSWLDTLNTILQAKKMFTTEMEIGLTTDLRILNSLPSTSIAEYIIQDVTHQNGTGSSASLAGSVFSVINAILASILTASAPGFVISKGEKINLRPDWKPIIVARKPLEGTVAENVLKWGTGSVNIDGCRVELNGDYKCRANGRPSQTGLGDNYNPDKANQGDTKGRWPANLIHDGSEEVVGLFPQSNGQQGDLKNHNKNRKSPNGCFGEMAPALDHIARKDSGSAARFFYCSKASSEDRNEGCDNLEAKVSLIGAEGHKINPTTGLPVVDIPRRNFHPTVKPTSLMRYLILLVTPPGGVVYDPFMGSGSTGKAALSSGFDFIGSEKEREFFVIARERLHHAFKTKVSKLI